MRGWDCPWGVGGGFVCGCILKPLLLLGSDPTMPPKKVQKTKRAMGRKNGEKWSRRGGEDRERGRLEKGGKASRHTPLYFQTLIYNFNISNFHSSAHFPNVIFQFMSNRVTIFLNTAYDKLGGKADMQFRLSVLQAQQQTHWGVCVFIFISVCSVF